MLLGNSAWNSQSGTNHAASGPRKLRPINAIQLNMAAGILHIIRLGQTRDKYDRLIADYQITYNVSSGNSFSRILQGDEALDEFLHHHAVVPTGDRERALSALHERGNATITGVEIPMKETAPLGMIQDASDY